MSVLFYLPNPCILGIMSFFEMATFLSLAASSCVGIINSKEHVCLMLQFQFVWRWLVRGGAVLPVSLVAVVTTILEKSVFYGYFTASSV